MENKVVLKIPTFNFYEISQKFYERILWKYKFIYSFKVQIIYPLFPKHQNDVKRA